MSITDIIGSWRDAIAGGGGNAIVLGAAALVLLLAVASAVVYILYLFSPRGRLELLVQNKQAKRRNRWPLRIVLLLFALVLPFAIQAGANTPVACTPCHAAAKKEVAKTAHQTASCEKCHGGRGVTASAQTVLSYARWGWASGILRKSSSSNSPQAAVDARNCLACHPEVSSDVMTRNGIRVRHQDFLTPSVSCLDCHGDVDHTPGSKTTGPSMSQCLPCHDGTKASAKCSVCHVADLAAQAVERSGESAPVNKVTISCVGVCHTGTNCLSCHGLVMPHPANWAPYQAPDRSQLPGGHARAAFANRDVCYRCHYKKGEPFVPSVDGCTCHGTVPGSMHGGAPWLKEHALEATGKKQGQLAECYMCHPANFCSYCHPASFAKQYNPKVGPDSYHRDIPRTPAEQATVNDL